MGGIRAILYVYRFLVPLHRYIFAITFVNNELELG